MTKPRKKISTVHAKKRRDHTGIVSTYNEKMVAKIIGQILAGKTVREITKPTGMPCQQTIFNWRLKYPEFREQYDMAMRDYTDQCLLDMLAIANDDTGDFEKVTSPDGLTRKIGQPVNVNRGKLRVDALKFYITYKAPKSDQVNNQVVIMISQRDAESL